MAVLGFGEYRPDIADTNAKFTSSIHNVVPRADGYGPVQGLSLFAGALAAPCRGLFFGRRNNGTVRIFAGTETKLYQLDNTTLTWTDVSQGAGTYSPLSSNANWSFAQFNSKIIAVQANAVPQVFDIETDSAFSDLGGSPPQAAYVTTVNRFLVLSGLSSNPNRIFWSGLNAITTWSSGTNFSDFQDLPDGGNAGRVVGGEFGVIIQDTAIRRMVFSPGSDIVFQIDRIARDIGSNQPHSVVDANGIIFFLSAKGFYSITADGAMNPVGRERIDRTFLNEYDPATPVYTIGAADPDNNRIFWTYKTSDNSADEFNKALVYDYVLDRWSPMDLEGQYIAPIAKPGLTLESLDTIGSVVVSGAADNGSGLIRLTVASTAGWTTGDIKVVADVTGTTEANGTWTITVIDGTNIDLQGSTFSNTYTSGGYVAGSLDDLLFSLDDVEAATMPSLAVIDTSNRLNFLSGDNLEATLETSETTAVSSRMFVRGMYPLTDAPTVYGSVGRRENFNATPSYTSEAQMTAQGLIPQRASTRLARMKLRIPSGTVWSYATGVDPDVIKEGKR